MEDNQKNVETTAEKVENSASQSNTTDNQSEGVDKKEKTYTRDEVNKIVNAERQKIRDEAEAKRIEEEKKAKMNEDQKLNYELEQERKEKEELKKQLEAVNLKNEANNYADSKNLPLGYIEDWDFTRETTDSVKEKIDKLCALRGKDLSNYLNEKLKQNEPKAVEPNNKVEDPYIKGFKSYKNK